MGDFFKSFTSYLQNPSEIIPQSSNFVGSLVDVGEHRLKVLRVIAEGIFKFSLIF